MPQQISTVLGLRQIYDLIEAPGEFLAEVKSRELKRETVKYAELRERYAQLQKLMDRLRDAAAERRSLRELLAHIPKLTLPARHSTQPLALHELFLIKEFLYHHGNLHAFIRKQGWMDLLIMEDLSAVFQILDAEQSGLPAFRISAAYSAKLGEITAAKLELANKLQHARKELLDEAREVLLLPQLKEEFVLSRAHNALADQILHSAYFVLSAESVANYSFVLADDELCLELKKQLSLLSARQEKEEAQILKELSHQIQAALPLLETAQNLVAQNGWRFMLADFALRHNCCIPSLHRKKSIRITAAVNLPLKLHLEENGRSYQALDYDFDQAISLLTGPNMGGKTTVLKTLGQLCWLARLGIPLPCKKAELPLFENIWYNQEEEAGNADLSSFGREVVAFGNALQKEGSTLYLLDEFAKGTNPTEGELLASAVLRYLGTTAHMCVAATHFTAPALLDGLAQYGIAGLDPDSGILKSGRSLSPAQRLQALSEAMDYRIRRLKKGQPPPLSAIAVARILGLPAEILNYIPKED